MPTAFRQKSQDELDRPSPAEARASDRLPVAIVLEDVRSGNNVGSVLRTADAFGLAEVILVGITPRPPHREILKASLGAEESVAWRYFDTVERAAGALRAEGHALWALEQTTGSHPLRALDFGALGRVAFVLGNEVRGVSPAALALVDGAVEIAQFGHKHSLNVSVAAGVLGYAARVQR